MFRRIVAFLLAFSVAAASAFCAAAAAFADSGESELNSEERNYIENHKTLKIGYVQDRIPVSFTDENGELAGISRYIFDRVSELCGIDFEYVPLPAGEVTYDYLIESGLDLVSSVEYNKENINARGILISNPYLTSRKVVVAREGLEFRYDANLSVAVLTGSQTIRKVLGEAYPNFELIDYPSITACIDAVNSGETDLMIQNQYVVEYLISKPIYDKLNVIPVLGMEDQLCFSAVVAFGDYEGSSEEDGRTLIGILNKAISQISEDEIGTYTIEAIMDNQYRYNLSDFLYRYRLSVNIIAGAAAVIIILAALLVRLHIKFVENKANEKARSQFLSTMSHELRTPLNGIIGLNRLMLDNPGDKERLCEYLRQSDATANYLLSLVNDMLDMSGLQDGSLELVVKPTDLNLVIGTVNSIAENAMTAKGIKYSFESKLEYPYVLGDDIRIQQVLLHLLDNAGKFTGRGGSVSLSVRQELNPDGKVMTFAEVSDTGRGMSEEFQSRIFDAFARELETVSKGNQGAGLGLPISRRLALMMGGDLSFVSRKGEGSRFTFSFAADKAEKPEDSQKSAELRPEEKPRVLVAEDNELNGEIIIELLREYGYEADLAENGKVALEMFEKSAPNEYGVILMDLLMPEMDGFEAAKAIRLLKREDAKTVKIFACTANSSDEDRSKARSSGMDDFITKPVDVRILIEKMGGANDRRNI